MFEHTATLSAVRLPRSVLILEDDEHLSKAMRAMLEALGYVVHVADSESRALSLITTEPIGALVVDLNLPQSDGRRFLRRLRDLRRIRDAVVFVCSSITDPQVKAECFALGVDVYFEKPMNISDLIAALDGRVQARTSMEVRANGDELTGLPNRAAARRTFERLCDDDTRQPISVAMLDLDHFKRVNDKFGHSMGDDVLRGIAGTLVDSLKVRDVVCRWGGEEFVILLPSTTEAGAASALEHAQNAVRGIEFNAMAPTNESFGVTFSAGVAEMREDESLTTLVARADDALYAAKASGRDRVVAHSKLNNETAYTVRVICAIPAWNDRVSDLFAAGGTTVETRAPDSDLTQLLAEHGAGTCIFVGSPHDPIDEWVRVAGQRCTTFVILTAPDDTFESMLLDAGADEVVFWGRSGSSVLSRWRRLLR